MIKRIKKLLGPSVFLFLGIFYTIFITVAFLTPTADYLPKIDFIIPLDKLIHVIIYIILVVIWLSYYFLKQYGNIDLKSFIKILFLCFIYGILIEVLQELFVPTRQADQFDVLANSIGLILGTFIFWNVKTRIKT